MPLDFRPLTLEHRSVVEDYMYRYGEGSCQHSFASMFCFNGKYGHSVCEKDGWLFVCREKLCDKQYRAYLMPMGAGDPSGAINCLRMDARAHSALVKLETVTGRARDLLEALCPGMFQAEEKRDYAEYIYAADKLANLPGSEMASRRYDVKTFWRKYAGRVSIREMTSDSADEARLFQEDWLKTHMRTEDKIQLEIENGAIMRALANFDALGLSGILLYVDGVLRGYAYGSRLSDDSYDVMIEKGDRKIEDIYRILNMEIVRRCCPEIRFVNREEDLGVPGLRKSKLSYKPDVLLSKYIMTENDRRDTH